MSETELRTLPKKKQFAIFQSKALRERDEVGIQGMVRLATWSLSLVALPCIHTAVHHPMAVCKQIIAEAQRLGDSRPANYKSPSILSTSMAMLVCCCPHGPCLAVVIYNPISGGGAAKRLVYNMVVPVLDA